MFSEDEDSEVLSNGQTPTHSQFRTPATKGLLSLNRLVRHNLRRDVKQRGHIVS